MTRQDAKNLALTNVSRRAHSEQLTYFYHQIELMEMQGRINDCLADMAYVKRQRERLHQVLLSLAASAFILGAAAVAYGLIRRN